MQARISFITLGVADLARARHFYQNVLGWTLSSKSQDGIAFFQLNGLVLGLYPRQALADDAGVPAAGEGFRGFSLSHNVAERLEVDALLERVATAGGTVLKAAEDVFWGGRSGYFCDPDGALWEVAWNPGGQLDADGNFWIS